VCVHSNSSSILVYTLYLTKNEQVSTSIITSTLTLTPLTLQFNYTHMYYSIHNAGASPSIVVCAFGTLESGLLSYVSTYDLFAATGSVLDPTLSLPSRDWYHTAFITTLGNAYFLTFLIGPIYTLYMIHSLGMPERVCILYPCMHLWVPYTYVYIYICVCVCVCIITCTYIRLHIHICTYICIYLTGDNFIALVNNDMLGNFYIWHTALSVTAGSMSILMIARLTFMISKIRPMQFDDNVFFERISGRK
jgi:hypothetical protein